MTAPSKMNIAQLQVALQQAKKDTEVSNSHWQKVVDRRDIVIKARDEANRFLNERNVKLEKVVTGLEGQVETQKSSIKDFRKHCNEVTEGRQERIDKINDLKAKIKCLRDELAKWQNQNTNNGVLWSEQYIVSDNTKTDVDYSYMDKFGEQQRGTAELTGNDPVVIPSDASKEIKRLEGELEINKNLVSLQCDNLTYWQGKVKELKLQATVADYDALKGDYSDITRLFIQQSIELRSIKDEQDADMLEKEAGGHRVSDKRSKL